MTSLQSIARTGLRVSREEADLREAEIERAKEVLIDLLETHHNRAADTKADEVYKISFSLEFSRNFSFTEVKGKVRYSRTYKDETMLTAKSAEQMAMELSKPQAA